MLAELTFPTTTKEGTDKEVGVGLIIGTGMVALYLDHRFSCSFSPGLARSVARRMLEIADLVEPSSAAE